MFRFWKLRFEAYYRSGVMQTAENAGWQFRRISGSHHIYSKPGERKIISVPVHGNREIKPGLATRIAGRKP